MAIIEAINAFKDEMTSWRRDIHAHPELAFEEHRTARLVADKLHSFGIDLPTGNAGTVAEGTVTQGR